MIIDPGGPSQNKGNLTSATSSQKAKAAVVTGQPAVAPAPKPLPSPTDRVSLSAGAQAMAKLESKISQAPDVDRGKVESIKQSIAEGRYKIDPHKIAAAILADEDYPQ